MRNSRPSLSTALISAALAALLLPTARAHAAETAAADQTPLPVAIVDALNKLSGGPHAGYRANHAKGVLVTGSFTPAAGAKALSRAAQFSKTVPVLVRFSNATGLPTMLDADGGASPHGMAIRFQLGGGASTDIVAISANGFPVATPEEFRDFLQAAGASGPGAKRPTPVEQFLGSHPAALAFVMTPRPAPQSFGTLAFYGVNAFKFTNARGAVRFIRYQILPLAGEAALDAAEVAKAGPNYLMDELPQRINKGAVKFRLLAQLAQDGDSLTDATQVWPAERERVELGVLSLNKTPVEQLLAQKKLLFNPLSLAAGIEPSDDPVLLARPAAYGVSYGQRAR